ncbi:MAG: DNA polymerase domain-containing protein [archaeon]|nr:DNA polymerase domain-containing protein [archaeon]
MHLQKIQGLLLDIASEQNEEGTSQIHLIVKTKEGVWEFIDPEEKPYFYIIFEGIFQELEIKLLNTNFSEEKGIEIRIQQMREVPKKNEQNAAQLFFKNTTDLVAIRDKIRKIHGVRETREADILFTRRYLIDKSLEPMSAVEIEWNKDNDKNNLLSIKKIDAETGIEFNDACFDLETYSTAKQFSNAEKDPIIMIGYVSDKTQKVLSYKKAKFKELELLKNEKECIQKLVELIKKEEIDFIYTYNGDSFDFPFIKTRAKKNSTDFGIGFNDSEPKAKRQGINQAVKIKGIQHVDVFQLMKLLVRFSVINLVKFDLESVVEQLYGEEKTKVFVQEMNEAWDSEKELEKVMQYNLEDTQQTMRLAKQYIPLVIEFSKLVKQTPFEVSRASASFLVEFLLIDKCFHSEILVPNKPIETAVKKRALAKFEGGYVREPVPGLHENIAVMDFRSLYPSIMISHNVSPETLNCECCKKEKKNLAPSGDYFCTKKTGFFKSILEELLSKRTKIKKELKTVDKKSPKYPTLYAQQYALKILLNSFYGYLGYARSRWYSFESAQAIASWARFYVKQIAEKADTNGFKTIYGDSLTNERFVTVLNSKGEIEVKNIEQFFIENQDSLHERGTKEIVKPKGYKSLSYDIENKRIEFQPINEIIRHKTNKKIFRVGQKFGETRVTEDHSIIAENNEKIEETKPQEMHGKKFIKLESIPESKQIERIDLYEYLKDYTIDSLYKDRVKISQCHKDENFVWFGWNEQKNVIKLKRFVEVNSPEFEALCRLLGAYIAEGSSSTPETTQTRNGASIASSNIEWLKELQQDYQTLFVNAKASIIQSNIGTRTLTYSNSLGTKTVQYNDMTHKLQMMNAMTAVFFKMLCGQKSNGKKLPQFIFNVSNKYKRILLDKYIDGDGSKKYGERYSEDYVKNNFKLETKSLELASSLSVLLSQLEIKYSIRRREEKQTYIIHTASAHNSRVETNIQEEKYNGFVYDLSVEKNHNFVDSCGNVLLHNTDSAFIEIPSNKTKKDVEDFVKKINSELSGVMELELENFYKRGIFVTKKEGGAAKKRYALLDENNNLKIVGFEYVRRDWSKVAKNTQKQVIEAVLKEGNPGKAIEIVRKVIQELREGKIPNKELIVYTQLTKSPHRYELDAPHVNAAKKAMKRGKHFESGSIIDFIITKNGKSISEKAEIAEYVKEGDYDAEYYIENQVIPAVIKIIQEFGLNKEDLLFGGQQRKLSFFG